MRLSEILAAGIGGAPQNWDKLVNSWRDTTVNSLTNLASVWTIYQLAIILVAYILARWLAGRVEAPIEARLRGIKNQPGLLRVLVTLLRHIDSIILAAILTVATLALQEITWPSNSYIVRVAAHLALAWGLVSTISRLIRNRALSKLFAATGWTIAALSIVGWLMPVLNAMDAAAIHIGNNRISLLLAVKSFALMCVLLWGASVLGDFLERRLRDGFELSPTMQVLSGKLVRWILIMMAVLASLSAVGVDLTAFTVLSGAIGIGIGFGLQKLASNLISGIIILTDRSIKPGDTITLGDMRGTINTLNARYVSVLTLTGAELLVPNERFVTETVVNWSFSNRRMLLEVPFGVDYRSDPHHVRQIALDVVATIPRALTDPPPRCQLRAFGDSSLDFTLMLWIDDPERGVNNIKSDILFGLWDAFKAENIAIPYPHREVILHQAPVTPPPTRTPAPAAHTNGNGHSHD
ncbi:MAG: mechanosensitive ion channel [Hyphomicrobiaceae bacterium]